MRIRFKATWGLLLIFLGLIAYVYFFDIPREKKEAEQKEKSEKLFDFSSDQVQQIELYSTKGHFLIQRSPDGKWRMKNVEAPAAELFNVLADSTVMDKIVLEVRDLRPTRLVDEKGEDLKSFGFVTPEKSIAVTLKNSSTVKLLVGDDAPLSQTLYVKRGNSGKIYLADSGIKSVVEYDFWNLRNKHLLSYDQILIDRVEVKTADQSWALTKKGEEWSLAERPAEKISEEKLSSFLFSAGTLDGEKVLSEEAKNLKEYGLDPPYATLQFHIKDKTHTLLIGKMKKEDAITALGDSAGPIFQIKKDFLGKIPTREELIKKEVPSPATTSSGNKTK